MERETVVVKTFASEVEAQLAQAYLEAEGVPAYLTGRAAAGMLDRSLKHGIALVTLQSQASRAEELLEALATWEERPPPEGEAVTLEAETARMFIQLGTALAAFGGMVLLLGGIALVSGSGTGVSLVLAAVLFAGVGLAARVYGRQRQARGR